LLWVSDNHWPPSPPAPRRETKPPSPANRLGALPLPKKKRKIPQPLKKSQKKEEKKKKKLVEYYCQKLTPQKPGGGTSPPGKIRGEKNKNDMSQELP
jgi:hypothetical protein